MNSPPTVINFFFGNQTEVPEIVVEGGKVTINGKQIQLQQSKPIEKPNTPESTESLGFDEEAIASIKDSIRKGLEKLEELEASRKKKTVGGESLQRFSDRRSSPTRQPVKKPVKKPKFSQDTERVIKKWNKEGLVVKNYDDSDFIGYQDVSPQESLELLHQIAN